MAKLIGTAGHVDHGKTSLIAVLTGIDTDRLPEEKKRGMSIELGFAYVDLPGHGRVSIVDVPGHERFLANMLVGALGIDVALLCVAADEGVMAQTREHFAILELLPVQGLVVALTKSDIVEEPLQEAAADDVRTMLKPTRFANAPIVPVSSRTGAGIEELKNTLTAALGATTEGAPGLWYLPVDRVFTMKGHGAVVTGTLLRGAVRVGDPVVVQPGAIEARVRQIHSHSESLESGEPGRRIALNLAGVKEEDLTRGMIVGAPGSAFETDLIDAHVRWVKAPRHGQRVRVSLGGEEAIGRVFLSESESDVVQLRLESKIACTREQPLIIRNFSPLDLLGGGAVTVPNAIKRKKSEAPEETPMADTNEHGILQILDSNPGGVPTEEVCRRMGKSAQELGDEFEKLSQHGKALGFAGLWMTPERFEQCTAAVVGALRSLHEMEPTKAFVPREKVIVTAGLGWAGKPLDRIIQKLVTDLKVVSSGGGIRLPEFRVRLTDRQQSLLDRVLEQLNSAELNTPSSRDIALNVNVPTQAVDEILRLGSEAGELVLLADGVVYTTTQLANARIALKNAFGGNPFTAAEARDALKTSRRYVIPLLERLDFERFTTRVGDRRMIG